MRPVVRRAIVLAVSAGAITCLAHFYAFKWSRPSFAPRFYGPEMAAKYATPEAAFERFDTALINHDAALYEESLGRPLTPAERQDFLRGSPPTARSSVVRLEKKKEIVYLATDRNAGEFFEFAGGRWAFTPEDLAANLRLFFRSFGL